MNEPKILDGREPAARERESLALEFAALRAELGRPVRLAIVVVGEDPRSAAYVHRKAAFGAEVGVAVTVEALPVGSSQAELEAAVARLGGDASVDGLMIQMPPEALDGYAAARLIPPEKDVDGLGDGNHAATLAVGQQRGVPGRGFVPATALAVLALLGAHEVPLAGRSVAVVGRSRLVGAPVAKLLEARGARVRVADVATVDLAAVTGEAEVVVSAAGVRDLLTPAHLREGAVVVDVGLSAGPDGKLAGDLAPEARGKLSAYSASQGGVGPLTVAMLFRNLALSVTRRPGRVRAGVVQ